MNAVVEFYAHIDVFLLVFTRMIGFLVVVPIFSGTDVPEIAKAGLAFMIAIIVMYMYPTMKVIYDGTMIGYSVMVMREVVIGLIIGFIVYILFQVFVFVGQLTSMSSGLGMSNMFDPSSGTQVPVIGNLYYYTACAIFLVTNGHHMIFRGIMYSYKVIPIGEGIIGPKIIEGLIMMLTNYFIISIKIAAPVMVTMFILDFALGILARTAPQMNIFVVGLPIKIIISFVMLAISTVLMNTAYMYIYDQIEINVRNVIQGMIK